MAFEKGDPKPANSGRAKKVGNKPKPDVLTVCEILKKRGFDVVERLLTLVESGELQARDEARVYLEIMSYIYAKPKQDMKIEMDNLNDPQQNMILSEVGNKIAEAINKWNEKK